MKHVSDLLGSLLERKHIRGPVEAARVIESANDWLETVMPKECRDDVCAMSVQNGMLIVACTSSASASYVTDHAQEGVDEICRKLPSTLLTRIHTRLVSEIQSHEF